MNNVKSHMNKYVKEMNVGQIVDDSPYLDQVDFDDDEECNIGGDAEEKCVIGYDRHFRSSTTKSGSSSNDRHRRSSEPAHNIISTEDDDDNFMSLECDENLEDEDRPYHGFHGREEEKVGINPKKDKKFSMEKSAKRQKSKEKRILRETLNDTLHDFGFIRKEETYQEKPKPKPDKKESKIVIDKKLKKGNKNHKKKLKIKKEKKPKKQKEVVYNENLNPYPDFHPKEESKEPDFHLEVDEQLDDFKDPEDSEINMKIDSIAAQYIPDCIYSDRSNHDDFSSNQFLYSQLECKDEIAEATEPQPETENAYDSFSAFNGCFQINDDIDKL